MKKFRDSKRNRRVFYRNFSGGCFREYSAWRVRRPAAPIHRSVPRPAPLLRERRSPGPGWRSLPLPSAVPNKGLPPERQPLAGIL